MNLSKFELDRQTLSDLSIYPDHTHKQSVLQIFDNVVTIGGKYKLKEIFDNPLTDVKTIQERIDALKYLQQATFSFKIDKGSCDYIEHYLRQPDKPTTVSKFSAIENRVAFYFTGNSQYYTISRGISYTLELIAELISFFNTNAEIPALLQSYQYKIQSILNSKDFLLLLPLLKKPKLNAMDIAKVDWLFRYKGFNQLKELLEIAYLLDVFIAVSEQGKRLNFNFPVINTSASKQLQLKGLFHPFVTKPISNHINFDKSSNVCFVTGANMAGKSTFLKAVGICVFLSQLGFPVPAQYMETSGFEGLVTTINVPDDIQEGNSHFYAEVSRVKHVAQQLNNRNNMVVIFDELFRGTNVKDAYDASLAVIKAFAKIKTSFFLVSTHIVEVAHELKVIENINFKFMETSFQNGYPKFSYQLQDGITEERLGMWIVTNEGIVDIIEKAANRWGE
jgi:DNA mismatch repair protein MutS